MPLGNDKLLDQIFNLKFTSKQLVKSSSKCEKEEKTEKLKVLHMSPTCPMTHTASSVIMSLLSCRVCPTPALMCGVGLKLCMNCVLLTKYL